MNAPSSGAAAVPPDVLAARQRSECVVSAADVQFALDQVAVRLAVRLTETNPLLLTVMNGGLPFAAELMRRWDFPMELSYLHVSRYRERTDGKDLRWHVTPHAEVAGRTVLFVDDVLDQGHTLAALVDWASSAGAAEVLTAVLVDKQVGDARPVSADYAALECPDRYLFGCGMDYRGYWRNLAGIYALPEDLAHPHGDAS